METVVVKLVVYSKCLVLMKEFTGGDELRIMSDNGSSEYIPCG